jgi:hypothetical protein
VLAKFFDFGQRIVQMAALNTSPESSTSNS